METQKTLTGESQDKDVDKSTSESKINGRFVAFKKAIGSLGGTPRPEILPFREINREYNEENTQRDNTAHCLQVGDKHRGSYIKEKMNEIIPRFDGRDGRNCLKSGRVPEIKFAQSLQTDGYLRQGSSFGTNNPQSSRNIRRLTPIECQRLQGFPDDFYDGIEMSDTQKYKQMGNAVTVNVVRAIAEKLK